MIRFAGCLFILSLLGAPAVQTAEAADVYRDGMIVREVQGPSGDDGYRLISMGVFSYNDQGTIVHRLEINDITDPSNVYGVSSGICEGPEVRSFTLKPGGRTYVLKNSGCGATIEFGRPGNEDQIKTSRDKLFVIRARYAVDHGQIVWLGKWKFFSMYQAGTEYPGFVLFREDVLQQIDANGPAAGRPNFFIQTQERDASGAWIDRSSPLRIGEWDGHAYELVRDYQLNNWSIREVQ